MVSETPPVIMLGLGLRSDHPLLILMSTHPIPNSCASESPPFVSVRARGASVRGCVRACVRGGRPWG